MRSKLVSVLVCLSLLAVVGLSGQAISEDELVWGSRPFVPSNPKAVRVQTNLVQVPIVVRDSQGKLVDGLQKGDFEVLDNGKMQAVSLFSVEHAPHAPLQPLKSSQPPDAKPLASTAPPQVRYVAFYFDDTNMPLADLVSAREAAKNFVRDGLLPGDKVGIFTSSTFVSLTFSDNIQAIFKTLDQLRTHWKRPSSICPKMRPYQAYLIQRFRNIQSDELAVAAAECPICSGDIHCVQNAADETLSLSEDFSQDTLGIITDVIRYLGRMPGHHMLLLTSSGFMTQTLGPQQDKVIAAAISNKVVINSLDAKGLVADNDFSDGPPVTLSGRMAVVRDQLVYEQREVFNDPLALLAQGTGGHFFHNSNDLGRGMRELSAIPEVSYVLGFSPENLKSNGSLHSLKVKVVNQQHLTIEARPAYYAPAPELSPSEKKLQRLNREVVAADNPLEIPTEVTTEPGMLASGVPVLKISVHVNVSKLPFQKIGDRKVERLIFVAALFDTQGHFLTGVQGVMDLRLKDATLATVSSEGLTAKLSFDAPAGSYRLRQVVQETWNGHLTAISRPVVIH